MFDWHTVATVGVDSKEAVDPGPDAGAFLCIFLELSVSDSVYVAGYGTPTFAKETTSLTGLAAILAELSEGVLFKLSDHMTRGVGEDVKKLRRRVGLF